MKILHLPANIASQPAITVQALNEAGHEAKGLFLQSNIMQSNRNLTTISYKKNSPVKFFKIAEWYFHFLQLVKWADVIHWTGSFNKMLLKICLPVIKKLNKPALVEFVGSDIRNPEIEFADNPFYKEVFHNGYEYLYESAENSFYHQKAFANAGFGVLIMPGMRQYVLDGLFKHKFVSFQRIFTRESTPVYPDPLNAKPLIVHAPSAPVTKGTAHILKAIETLKNKYEFSFELIENMPHAKALERIKQADIFIDQLILGGYGMALMEAMSFGKPVVCFIKESIAKEFPSDLAIVNANPLTISEKLELLLSDAIFRRETGIKSRVYVEKYHDVEKVIPALVETYTYMHNIFKK